MIASINGDKVAQWNYVSYKQGYIVTAVCLDGNLIVSGEGKTLCDAMKRAGNKLPSEWSLAVAPQDNRVEA
jgi:hypothetical protein